MVVPEYYYYFAYLVCMREAVFLPESHAYGVAGATQHSLIHSQVHQEEERDSDEEVYGTSDGSESSDEDRTWKEVKKQHKIIRRTQAHGDNESESKEREHVYELNEAPRARNLKSITRVNKASLGDRLSREALSASASGAGGNREMKFTMRGKKSDSENQKKMKKHYQERKQIVRKTGFLAKKRPRKY